MSSLTFPLVRSLTKFDPPTFSLTGVTVFGKGIVTAPWLIAGGSPLDFANGVIPLLSTVVPTRGSLTPSFTRATAETGQKYDSAGYLDFTALSGEVIFKGAMRVENRVPMSEDFTGASFSNFNTPVSTTLDAADFPSGAVASTVIVADSAADGRQAVTRLTVGRIYQAVIYAKGAVGGESIYFTDGNGTGGTKAVTTAWAQYSVTFTAAVTNIAVALVAAGTVKYSKWQIVDIAGETDQTTIRPYVSVGVQSSPAYHGSCVDGVKCFPTDLNGTPIPRTGSYPLVGYVPWEARTNHFLNSGTPATHTSGSLGTGTYTLWMTGTGSIAVAGTTATITGAGTATAGTPVTFVVTVAGTVTYTVTGSPTKAQSENGAFPTPYIITAGAPVPRNADLLTYTGAEIANYKAMACTFSRGVGIASAGGILCLTDGTANNKSEIILNSATQVALAGVSGGVAQWSVNPTYTPATQVKASWSTATNDIKMDFNGTAQTPDAVATVPAVTQINVGHEAGSYVFNGPVTDLYFWTRNLSQSELGAVDR